MGLLSGVADGYSIGKEMTPEDLVDAIEDTDIKMVRMGYMKALREMLHHLDDDEVVEVSRMSIYRSELKDLITNELRNRGYVKGENYGFFG